MALIACPDCKKEFSDLAKACPNCGRPIRAVYWTPARILLAIVLGIIVFGVASHLPDLFSNLQSRRTNNAGVTTSPQTQPAQSRPAFESFTEKSTYSDVVSSLGKPDAEKDVESELPLPLRLICYEKQNLCVALVNLKPPSGTFYYIGTLRINPAEVLHRVNREGGDSGPLMEMFRQGLANLWADIEKQAKTQK